jgi:ABC-type lipoprotein release transport system permease subunit
MALAGTAIGLLAAAGLQRLLDGWRVAVATPDLAAYAAAALMLLLVGLLACLLPMHRAGRTDPASVLRDD